MSTNRAPIDRSIFDHGTPFLRLVLGVMFIGFSGSSTVVIGADDIGNLFKFGNAVTIAYVQDRFWYAAIFAVILTIGQFVTSGKYPKAYACFLSPDAFYTARGVQLGLWNAVMVLAGGSEHKELIAFLVSWLAGLAIGVLIARYGEILVLGRPAKTARQK